MMKYRHIVTVAVMLPLLVLPIAAQESQDPGLVAQSLLIEVEPKAVLQFETAYRQHLELHSQGGDSWSWHTWQIINGDLLGQYIIRTHGHHWKDFDDRAAMQQMDSADFMANVAPHVERMSSTFQVYDPKISNWPADAERPTIVELTIFDLSYTGWRDFYHAVERIHAAVLDNKPEMHYAWSTTVNGSDGPQMMLAVPHSSWADMAPEETPFWQMIEEVHGDHETQMLREMVGRSIRSQSTSMVSYREDLSYVPGP
jgi:hypothetical protein